MTIYRQREEIAGVTVFTDSRVKGWSGWSSSILHILRRWNKQRRLSFPYHHLIFKCFDCKRFIRQITPAFLDGIYICDDCLTTRAQVQLREDQTIAKL